MRHFLLFLALSGCAGAPGQPPPSVVCKAGERSNCYCERVEEFGTQECAPDGLRWGACQCTHEPGPDAGPFFCYDGGCLDAHSCHYGDGPGFYGSGGGACSVDGG